MRTSALKKAALGLLTSAIFMACGKSSKNDNPNSSDALVGDFFLTESDFKASSLEELDSYDVENAAKEEIFSSAAIDSAEEDSAASDVLGVLGTEGQDCLMNALEKSSLTSPEPSTLQVSISANLAVCLPPDDNYKVEKLVLNLYAVTQCPEADFTQLNGKNVRQATEQKLLESYKFMDLCTTVRTAQHSMLSTMVSFKQDDGSVISAGNETKSFKGGKSLRSLCEEQISDNKVLLSDDCSSLYHSKSTGIYVDGKKQDTPLDSELRAFRGIGLTAELSENNSPSPFVAGSLYGVINDWDIAIDFNDSGEPTIQVYRSSPQLRDADAKQNFMSGKSHANLDSVKSAQEIPELFKTIEKMAAIEMIKNQVFSKF